MMNHRFGKEEEEAVLQVLRSGELSMYFQDPTGGPVIREFEGEAAKYHGVKHAVATSNGTTALQTMLLACGVGPGDFVVVPALTFIATATSVLACGATPIFADVESHTYNISALDVEGIFYYLEHRVKAVLAVNLLGLPAKLPTLQNLCAMNGGMLLEDNAQSLGGKIKGKLAGTFGVASTLSGQQTKTLTFGGEGGMMLTNDDGIAEKARQIRSHGAGYADSPFLTYNFRLSSLHAAVGLAQFRKLDRIIGQQVKNARQVIDALPKGIHPPTVPPNYTHTYYIIGCTCDRDFPREKFIKDMEKAGVSTGMPGSVVSLGYTQPLYRKPLLQSYMRLCPDAEDLCKRWLFIDCHRFKSDEEMEPVLKAIREWTP